MLRRIDYGIKAAVLSGLCFAAAGCPKPQIPAHDCSVCNWRPCPSVPIMPSEILFDWSVPILTWECRSATGLVSVAGVYTAAGIDAALDIVCNELGLHWKSCETAPRCINGQSYVEYRLFFSEQEYQEQGVTVRMNCTDNIEELYGRWEFESDGRVTKGVLTESDTIHSDSMGAWIAEHFAGMDGILVLQEESALPLRGAFSRIGIRGGAIVGEHRVWGTDGSFGETVYNGKGEPVLLRSLSPNAGGAFIVEQEMHGPQLEGIRWAWSLDGVPLSIATYVGGALHGLGISFSNGVPATVWYAEQGAIRAVHRIDR